MTRGLAPTIPACTNQPSVQATDLIGAVVRLPVEALSAVFQTLAGSAGDFLKPLVVQADDPEQSVRGWTDDKSWPKNQRQQALAAVEPARQLTSTWLQHRTRFIGGREYKSTET